MAVRKYKMGVKFYIFITLAYLIALELGSLFILLVGGTIGDNIPTGANIALSGIFGVAIGDIIADSYAGRLGVL